jgi:hypothetical protein
VKEGLVPNLCIINIYFLVSGPPDRMPTSSFSSQSNSNGSTNSRHKLSTSTSTSSSSYDAFASVDELVSKPVLGSDGAASWQAFRSSKDNSRDVPALHRPSSAPKAPLKRADKLGTGFTSWEEERDHEERIRQSAGHATAGSGYTVFKKKDEAGEAAERKRQAQIKARIRPDDQEYFIPSKIFQGWKFDYVFTTRPDRGGTGYFWDGMDSINKLDGTSTVVEGTNGPTPPQSDSTTTSKDDQQEVTSSEPKKKKRKKDKGPVIIHDPTNPIEQVQVILARRNQQLLGMAAGAAPITTTIDPTLADGWETASDPSSGQVYFFNRASGERRWEKPEKRNLTDADTLPDGWKSAMDNTSGKTYYYHATTGETKWEKPQ